MMTVIISEGDSAANGLNVLETDIIFKLGSERRDCSGATFLRRRRA